MIGFYFMKEILGKRILWVTAHPDDESFLAAGTIAANAAAGGENVLFCATHGERGLAYVEEGFDRSRIKEVRKAELLAVVRHLGIGQLEMGHFPDGLLEDCVEELNDALARFVCDFDFDVMVSFGEDGVTGHRDHIAVGRVARRIASERKVSFVEFARPKDLDIMEYLAPKRINGVYRLEGAVANEANLWVAANAELKLEALRLHASQFRGLDPYRVFPKEIAEHLLGNEYFYAEILTED